MLTEALTEVVGAAVIGSATDTDPDQPIRKVTGVRLGIPFY